MFHQKTKQEDEELPKKSKGENQDRPTWKHASKGRRKATCRWIPNGNVRVSRILDLHRYLECFEHALYGMFA